MSLSLYNLDNTPMPAGLGLPPFFPRAPGTQLALDLSERLLTDERGIPTTRIAFAPGNYALSGLDETDNLLLGGKGSVTIAGATGTTHINAIGAIGFHLYVSSGQGIFCAEPVTHLPNSFRAECSEGFFPPWRSGVAANEDSPHIKLVSGSLKCSR